MDALLHQTGVEFFDLMFAHDNPYNGKGESLYLNVQLNYEKMRLMAIREGYKKVWVVEADTIPPVDALSKLLEVDAPMVSGVYALRHGLPVPNLLRRSNGGPNPGDPLRWDELKGIVTEVSGGCMGCLLMDVDSVKDFSFLTGKPHPPDMDLMRYCHKNKIKQMARLDVLCGHKKASGEILWPQDYLN